MAKSKGITQHFGANLAELLADKILNVYKEFPKTDYVNTIKKSIRNRGYTQRIELHADELHNHLPKDYKKSSKILVSILGEENQNETGMFTEYYWVMPIGKYVEKYGIEHFDLSMHAISEITKRNTGEYAIRPFIRLYPKESLKQITDWAYSSNFHLRRLASEGLRPKLPWSTKLDTFNDNPKPVFKILEILKEDEVMFVKKSVGNHLTDWLKVNKTPTVELIKKWQKSANKNTQWIIKRATRKIDIN
ncbi:MAG: DNA alkylation repair protein [Anaerolineae bacterium]|nr:DNA alkylation repair protein [Anaerolineae bacterium]